MSARASAAWPALHAAISGVMPRGVARSMRGSHSSSARSASSCGAGRARVSAAHVGSACRQRMSAAH
eukprot:2685280-Prymnesium_polylepis.1